MTGKSTIMRLSGHKVLIASMVLHPTDSLPVMLLRYRMTIRKHVMPRLKPFLFVILTLMVSACASRSNLPPSLATVEGPLPPPFQDPILTQNRWRLVSVVVNDEPLDYWRINPVYITFYPEGPLGYNTTNCNAGGFYVTPLPNNKFRLEGGAATAALCEEEVTQQYNLMFDALHKLTAYELTENEQLLIGENITATLIMHNP